ncbi:MAG: hypothetical protein RMJ19_02835 [Gemmatales bacterium]|nr:hypothetical protein [Gemmatales bacterium]MCS7159385.1 hypothetical protein [Gemmatales bacterium]MDW8174584.1 hypothetical protein [Gemmatales bacterium]MDW8223467.1 hypothetical protein [Gemmatales bacterium]
MRKCCYLLAATVLMCWSVAQAQEPPRFRLRTGEVLQYRVQQKTRVSQSLEGESASFESVTELVKRWQVLQAEADGSMIVQLTIPEIKLMQRLPNGQNIMYDSSKPDESHPALRQQMEQFLGKPTVKLKLDARGQVLEAQALLAVPVGHFAQEPPFAIVLPQDAWRPQLRWTRPYTLVLEPPLGTGEKYHAEQQLELRSWNDQQAEIAWLTDIKNPPATASEKIPLLQKITRGVAVFDQVNRRVTLVRIEAGGTVEGHEGPRSKYEFFSEYVERLMP